MAASTWKGMISFGLVSIPIRLYTAARSKRIGLHQIHSVCKTRLRQPLFCPHCDRIVERSEVVKGYEYEKGQYALVNPEEIKKITPPSGQTMEILAFLNTGEVDPVYFDSSYFALPEPHAEKPYVLLMKALENTGKVGVAKVTMHQREYTVFIRARDNGLTLHTMYYQNEIARIENYGKEYHVSLRPEEVKLADQLVQSLTAPFKPEQYKDEFQEQLAALIESKVKGKVAPPAPHKPGKAPVIDMMEALKRSLAQQPAASTGSSGKTHPKRTALTPVAQHRPRRKAS